MRAALHPDAARAAAVLRALAGAARSAEPVLPPGVPDADAASARLAGGVHALSGEALMGWDDLLRGVAAVAAALAGAAAPAGSADAAGAVRDRLARPTDAFDRDLVVQAALEGAWDVVESAALPLDLDPDVLVTVLDWATRPALRVAAARLAPALASVPWSRGRCPACGSAATLSVMQGKERERRLHCGRCGTSWAFERVRCSCCGQRDHALLGYLHAEGEGEYRRAEVCDACRGYVKSVSLLDPPDPDRLLALDLETAALDFLSLDAGYSRAPSPG